MWHCCSLRCMYFPFANFHAACNGMRPSSLGYAAALRDTGLRSRVPLACGACPPPDNQVKETLSDILHICEDIAIEWMLLSVVAG